MSGTKCFGAQVIQQTPPIDGVIPASVTNAVAASELAKQIGPRFGRVVLAPLYSGTLTGKGIYAAGTAYVVGDAVNYSGAIYRCIQNGTGQQPDTSPLYWTAMSDEAARINAVAVVCATNKWELRLSCGVWPVYSAITPPRSTPGTYNNALTMHLDDARIASGIIDTGSSFIADCALHSFPTFGTAWTVTAISHIGSQSIATNATTGLQIGDYIRIMSPGVGSDAYGEIHRVLAVGSNTIIPVDPVDREYPAAAPGSFAEKVLTRLEGFHLIGHGSASISGTGQRLGEFFAAFDCHVENITMNEEFGRPTNGSYLWSWDIACRDCDFVACHGVSTKAKAIYVWESATECHAFDCKGENTSGGIGGVDFGLYDACRCALHECSGRYSNQGVNFDTNGAAIGVGCRDCRVVGGSFCNMLTNGVNLGKAASTAVVGITCRSCAAKGINVSATSVGSSVEGCLLSRNLVGYNVASGATGAVAKNLIHDTNGTNETPAQSGQATLDGASPSVCTVSLTSISTGQVPKLTLITKAGTGTGLAPTVTVTAGTGFVLGSVNGDQSVWAWEV